MTDPVLRLAQLRIIKASADLEVAISTRQGGSIAIDVLRRLRQKAAESLVLLVFVNFDDPADLIKAKVLQNEVKRYDEWVEWLREIINEGKALDQQMSEDDRREMLDVLLETPEGEKTAEALGLVDPRTEGDG